MVARQAASEALQKPQRGARATGRSVASTWRQDVALPVRRACPLPAVRPVREELRLEGGARAFGALA